MLIIVLLVLIAVVVVRNIVIVPQAHAYVVERLGVYNDTLEPGLHIILPVVDRIASRISLKEQVLDFP